VDVVRIKGETGKEWLLIKETGDGHVRRGVREPYDDTHPFWASGGGSARGGSGQPRFARSASG